MDQPSDGPYGDHGAPSERSPEDLLEELAVVRSRIDAALDGIGRVIPVMSGKGGVGKSAVAVNLALALAGDGDRVGLLDADLNSPSVARMLGLRGRPVHVSGTDLVPAPGPRGVLVQSMDFFLQGTQPLDWDGPGGEGAHVRSALEDAALADLLGQTRWEELDTLLVDLAPGGDRLPALARLTRRLTGAIAVTIPTEVALLAVERSVRRAHEARVPMVGLVENMGTATCSRCGHQEALFREAPVESLASQLDMEVIARIPFDARLAAAADAGQCFLDGSGGDTPTGRVFHALAGRVRAFAPPADEEDSW